jgi:hypothetical protein
MSHNRSFGFRGSRKILMRLDPSLRAYVIDHLIPKPVPTFGDDVTRYQAFDPIFGNLKIDINI